MASAPKNRSLSKAQHHNEQAPLQLMLRRKQKASKKILHSRMSLPALLA
jgi:hypothetical protein